MPEGILTKTVPLALKFEREIVALGPKVLLFVEISKPEGAEIVMFPKRLVPLTVKF